MTKEQSGGIPEGLMVKLGGVEVNINKKWKDLKDVVKKSRENTTG